jgi:hypothetical protein
VLRRITLVINNIQICLTGAEEKSGAPIRYRALRVLTARIIDYISMLVRRAPFLSAKKLFSTIVYTLVDITEMLPKQSITFSATGLQSLAVAPRTQLQMTSI